MPTYKQVVNHVKKHVLWKDEYFERYYRLNPELVQKRLDKIYQAEDDLMVLDQSSTGSTPAFKPVVVAAINLYQLASTRPPVTRLMNFRRALSARDPDSGFYHEASDSFLAKNQTVNFLQIFQRQRGAKITVVLPDYTECLIYQ